MPSQGLASEGQNSSNSSSRSNSGSNVSFNQNSNTSGSQGSSQGQQNDSANDSSGQAGQNAQSALPTPPANAIAFPHIERMGTWGSCNTKECSGGSGTGEYWMAANQTTPSMDGSSLQFHNSGVWSDALWWNKLGEHDSVTNFLWDFYFRVDERAARAAQALEFDLFQFREGYNYMMGSQCNYASGAWDLWDEASGKWIRSSVACPKFSPGVWHHVQWYTQRVSGAPQYTFATLVVDGVAYPINQTYSAKNVGWSKNVGVQYQLDVNASGAAYEMWVDRSTLTVW